MRNSIFGWPVRRLLWLVLALMLLASVPVFAPTYYVSLLLSIFMFVALTESWALFCGPSKYMSFLISAFVGIGMYWTAFAAGRLPISVVAIVAGVSCALVAALIGTVALRLRGLYFSILTLAIAELIKQGFIWWQTHLGSSRGHLLPVRFESQTIYYYLLGAAVVTVAVAYVVKRSRLGLALVSIGDDEERAQTLGLNVALIKSVGFVISAFFMGAVGALVAARWAYVEPTIAFKLLVSIQVIIMALLGGLRTVEGPIIGALALGLLSELLLLRFTYFYLVILGVTLIAVALFMPQGVMGFRTQGWKIRHRLRLGKRQGALAGHGQ